MHFAVAQQRVRQAILMGAGGIVEVITCVQALNEGILPPHRLILNIRMKPVTWITFQILPVKNRLNMRCLTLLVLVVRIPVLL